MSLDEKTSKYTRSTYSHGSVLMVKNVSGLRYIFKVFLAIQSGGGQKTGITELKVVRRRFGRYIEVIAKKNFLNYEHI